MYSSNRDFIGRTQPLIEHVLTPETVADFLDATGDLNPRYVRDGRAPPMSVVAGTIARSIFTLLRKEDFIRDSDRLLTLLHGEEDIRWFDPIRSTDTLRMRTTVVDLDDKSLGELMSLQTVVESDRGTHLATVDTQFVIRESKPAGERVRSSRVLPTEPALSAEAVGEVLNSSWSVEADQAVRYAKASGDENPIHLDEETARRAGLKGCVLHGLCTMAFAARSVIELVVDGEPERLKRLKVRFTRPVYMGDTLHCSLQPVAISGHYRVSVQNQDGVLVLRDGVAEVDSSP